MWDVFISHASEDKEVLVRPLAEELVKYGVNVWYDEFALELGDSLTSSIDKGLLESRFGLIIISPAFFQKKWTDYELKSLLTKELNGGKIILPVWHNVDQKIVSSKSLFLADKKAISSNAGIQKLAFEVVKIVRPDIINSHLIKQTCRRQTVSAIEQIPLKNLDVIDGVRHESLPTHLILASMLIAALFPIGSVEEVVKNFAKDADYDQEFAIWISMSCAYIDTLKKFKMAPATKIDQDNVFLFLLWLSMNDTEKCEAIELNAEVKDFLSQSYLTHARMAFPLLKI